MKIILSFFSKIGITIALVSIFFSISKAAVPFCNGQSSQQRLSSLLPLFEFHKSYNPQNVLIIFATAGANCRFANNTQHPGNFIDMVWRMNAGAKNECLEEATAEERSNMMQKMALHSFSKDGSIMIMDLKDLNNFRTDLPTHFINITLTSDGKSCGARPYIQLGPSQKNTVIRVQELFAEVDSFIGIPTGVSALTITGQSKSGQLIRARFTKR